MKDVITHGKKESVEQSMAEGPWFLDLNSFTTQPVTIIITNYINLVRGCELSLELASLQWEVLVKTTVIQ